MEKTIKAMSCHRFVCAKILCVKKQIPVCCKNDSRLLRQVTCYPMHDSAREAVKHGEVNQQNPDASLYSFDVGGNAVGEPHVGVGHEGLLDNENLLHVMMHGGLTGNTWNHNKYYRGRNRYK